MSATASPCFTLPPTHPTSCFLSLEGIEAAGKSAQGEELKKYLSSRGKEVSLFREPGGTPFGEGLRKSVLEGQNPLAPIAEAYLFASSRAQLLQQEILPRLQRPQQVVIVDRYYDSSVAYQGFARGLGPETIAQIHGHPPLHYMPHLTLYLHISVELSVARLDQRGRPKDYFESQGEPFFKKMAEGYDWCMQHYPDRVVRIDGEQSMDAVARDMADAFEQRFEGPK